MVNSTPRRWYHDYQPPRLYRAGVTLRRSFLVGPAATPEEASLRAVLDKADGVPASEPSVA